jgi:lactate dehydrogenase-like 2-hydroxyacid dehydrogenase
VLSAALPRVRAHVARQLSVCRKVEVIYDTNTDTTTVVVHHARYNSTPRFTMVDTTTDKTADATATVASAKPILLHLGAAIQWNHELYELLETRYTIVRTHSMSRAEFMDALKSDAWGSFTALYRPFWNTGNEMAPWDTELIALLPTSVRIFASAGAGFDWVDTGALAARGIIYCNAAAACTESAADAALWMVLSVYRLFGWSFEAARSCNVIRFLDANKNIAARTHNPNGGTLGVVGLGRIGFRAAQKLMAACEMRIAYHDVVRFPERERELGARWCETLKELLGSSDCVLLATPFSGSTLLSYAQFKQFRHGARLVNVARGGLVDEDALYEALVQGVVGAAALDVHAEEPIVNSRLAEMRNVIVTAHTAGASVESHVGFERMGMENLLGWLERGTEGCVSAVNLEGVREWERRRGEVSE